MSIRTLGINLSDIFIRNLYIFIQENALKMSSGKWWSVCLGLSVLSRCLLSVKRHVNANDPFYHLLVVKYAYDDVIKWKHIPRYWPFVRGIHRPPVNSPHKGQWRGASMFSLTRAWLNGWVNNREAGDLSRRRAGSLWRYCNEKGCA